MGYAINSHPEYIIPTIVANPIMKFVIPHPPNMGTRHLDFHTGFEALSKAPAYVLTSMIKL
jgi:hypothetical protein